MRSLLTLRLIRTVCLFALAGSVPGWAAAPGRADQIFTVTTASLRVEFDPQGARPVAWTVIDPRYVSSEQGGPVELIDRATATTADARTPFDIRIADDASTAFFREALYQIERHDDEGHIRVSFTSPASPSGLVLVKSYELPKRGFAGRFTLTWHNTGTSEVTIGRGPLGPAIRLGPGLGFTPVGRGGLSDGMYAFVAPAVLQGRTPQTLTLDSKHPSVDFDAAKSPVQWAGIHSRYFLFALAPGESSPGDAIRSGTASLASPMQVAKPELTLATSAIKLRPGDSQTRRFAFFTGPKATAELQAAGFHFDRVLFSRVWVWLRWLCFALLKVLTWLHHLVPSWGLSLILLAALIRLVTFPVAQIGLREQSRFNAAHARLRPELARIKLEGKGDPQRQHQETMALYRAHGVSPFAAFKGCGWVLLQVPIFIALFNLIGQEYALRGAGFLWIDDLSQPDRLFSLGVTIPLLGSYFNILPLLMGATQVFVSNLSPPAGGDAAQAKQQRRNMLLMAAAFTILFYTFPSGLIIYWTAANLGHLVQQRLVARWTPAGSSAQPL